MFSRIAVVNRGEAAMRLINAVADLRAEAQHPVVIALHTAAERSAMFVREADEAVEISSTVSNPYLDYAELERALLECNADAVWVGWGFVAEHADFADLCERIGVTFIGPSGDVMRRLGDKIGAKLLAEENNVPVAPWSGGAVSTLEHAIESASAIGYPLMVKATSGGGGRGIRRVDREEDLAEAIERAQSEGAKSFGDPTVFMERVVENARHIEVQVAADVSGNAWALGVRDCSVQRRNQKIIEESHSPVLTEAQEAEIGAAAIRLVRAANYTNVGTVEFLYQPVDGSFAFLEVNTRLQVEHTVTEATTGVDLVRLQLQLAAGWGLAGSAPARSGHAIEARLNAEDVDRGFAPAPGVIDVLRFPGGPGIRIDTGFAEGDVIPADYDSMIAKIIAIGSTRSEARHRLRRALMQTNVVIAGGVTNKSFVIKLLDLPEFNDGAIDTAWLDRALESGALTTSTAGADIALISTALSAWNEAESIARKAFFLSAGRGRPSADIVPARAFEMRNQGERYAVTVSRLGPTRFLVEVDDAVIEVEAERMGAVESRLSVAGRRHRVVTMRDGAETLVEVDGQTHRVSLDDGGAVRAPSPSLVVKVLVSPGMTVSRGAPLVVVEAMKVETTLSAPFDGEITSVLTSPNMQVDVGAVLLKIEATSTDDEPQESGGRIAFAELVSDTDLADRPRTKCLRILDELRWFLLGFERPAPSLNRLLAEYRRVRNALSPNDVAVLRSEVNVLRAFTDVLTLSRNRPADEVLSPETHSPQEYFHRYLRALDADAEGLSEDFKQKLDRALVHFGVEATDQGESPASGALEEAAYGIFKSKQQTQKSSEIILELLASTHPVVSELPDGLGGELHDALTALAFATQNRYRSVGDAARTYTFETFDGPVLEAGRLRALDASRDALELLASSAEGPARSAAMTQLVSSPYRLIRLLNDRDEAGDFAQRDELVEVLTRRNYQIRELDEFRLGQIDTRRILTVGYFHNRQRFNVIATLCDAADFVATAGAAASVSFHAPDSDAVVIDLYVRWADETADPDQIAHQLGLQLASVEFPGNVQRIAVSGVSAHDDVLHFTYRQNAGRFVEDPIVRGLHPLIAQRLQLGRLTNFSVERLESPDDTYLFRLVGTKNPDDIRLFAAAEIRDFTMERDADGRVTDLPELTRRLTAALDGMRQYRDSLPDREQPPWNRVMLYVWPVVDVPVDDFNAIASRLAPLTQNLGLEEVRVQAKVAQPSGEPEEVVVRIGVSAGGGIALSLAPVPSVPMKPLDAYTQKLLAARRRGIPYPYEIIPMLVGEKGTFVEYDLTESSTGQTVFAAVERPAGRNEAGVVVGLVSTASERYPEGMTRVAILGDPTKALGTVAQAECIRILGAFDLADALDVPIEWFALSSGAKIAMDSGTENMDWISRVLRRIIDFTQAGGEVNVVVTGINVGAQPYWNAEATMLMHTKGILVMTPDSAMVLTGKQALDYSGGVSAEDNFGIGGFDRIMGPNGQAQYWAPDLEGAVDVLFAHYSHSYVARGERFPRAASTNDPIDRDVQSYPHTVEGLDFTTVGDVFSDQANPGRKKPFDIRSVMSAVADLDHPTLERWAPMRDAETVVVFDAHLGGHPITLIGVESQPMDRHGRLPADGPDQWTAGTLFPLSSKKMARAINAASGSRPLVVLANLSGFDGSPESLSRLQLEFGAEIGRAVVNFDGPIVFCVVSRFHGGAFVVFSGALHDNMQVLAVEGTHASVLGGAPAAAVVFAGDVRRRVEADERMVAMRARLDSAGQPEEVAALRSELAELRAAVHSEKLGEVAAEFDEIHSIDRARDVGSVHQIIPADQLRPRLISSVRKGMSVTTGDPYHEPEWPQPFEAAVASVVPLETDYSPQRDENEMVHWLDDVPGFITEDDEPDSATGPPEARIDQPEAVTDQPEAVTDQPEAVGEAPAARTNGLVNTTDSIDAEHGNNDGQDEPFFTPDIAAPFAAQNPFDAATTADGLRRVEVPPGYRAPAPNDEVPQVPLVAPVANGPASPIAEAPQPVSAAIPALRSPATPGDTAIPATPETPSAAAIPGDAVTTSTAGAPSIFDDVFIARPTEAASSSGVVPPWPAVASTDNAPVTPAIFSANDVPLFAATPADQPAPAAWSWPTDDDAPETDEPSWFSSPETPDGE